MKKLLSYLMAAMAFIFVGCTDENEMMVTANRTMVRLTPESNASTRASAGAPQIDGYHLRYILEAYEQLDSGELSAKMGRYVQTTSNFELDLKPGKKYTLLAWADYVSSGQDNANMNSTEDEFYNTTDLKNVQMIISKWTLNTDAKDAFCTVQKDVQQNTSAIEMTLKRPLAQLNIKTKTPVERAKTVQITYLNIYTAFNILNGDVVGTSSKQTFSAPVLTAGDATRITYDYLFVHPLKDADKYAQGSSLYNVMINLFSSTETSDQADTSYEVEFVPFSPNYRTNLTCADIPEPGAQKTQVSVSVNADFEANELNDPKQFINSSYIRTSFYETGRIYDKSLQTCNDLIYLVANPYFGGVLYFETPENSFELPAGATWMANYQGRNGVVSLNGSTQLDGKRDLLNKPTGEFPKFTFATWVYLDEWTANAYLFKKQNGTNEPKVALQLGASEGQLTFKVDAATHTFNASALQKGAWHHVALVHDGTKTSSELFVDGVSAGKASNIGKLPSMNAYFNMYLGSNLKGKLDETFFSMLPMSVGEISGIKDNGMTFKGWNETKVQAYWKFDDQKNPGHDSHSWITIMNDLRPKLAGKDIKFRLGVSGGDWEKMMSNEGNRSAFANNIKQTLEQYHFDGVDFDFEWSYSEQQFANYSATILKVKEVLGDKFLLSVSLHPISYKISKEAIAACDWISMQCYGPKGTEFPYEKYTEGIQAALNYGVPAEKLVPGLPFYGTKNWSSGGSEGTAAYFDMVKDGAVTSKDQDELTNYKGAKYWLNSYNTIQRKVRYAIDQHLRGVMSWDLATDCDYNNPLSLQRAVVEEIWE